MAIATAIDTNDVQSMTLACSILAALAVLDHEKVLAAIGDAAKFTSKHRFLYIVKALTTNDKDARVSSSVFITY